MALSPKHKGDLAELHVAAILLSDSELEVFVAACDDGHGSVREVGAAEPGAGGDVDRSGRAPQEEAEASAAPWEESAR
jgi:hypothetical protein